jgi:hypothetical protein
LLERRDWPSEDLDTGLPAEFELDRSFRAVALGPTSPSEFSFDGDVDRIALANALKPEELPLFYHSRIRQGEGLSNAASKYRRLGALF